MSLKGNREREFIFPRPGKDIKSKKSVRDQDSRQERMRVVRKNGWNVKSFPVKNYIQHKRIVENARDSPFGFFYNWLLAGPGVLRRNGLL